jgi:hypothetical protein
MRAIDGCVSLVKRAMWKHCGAVKSAIWRAL